LLKYLRAKEKMPVARPMVTPVALPFFMTKRHGSPSWSSIRVAHMVFLYEILKLEEAVIRILKHRGGVGVGEHL